MPKEEGKQTKDKMPSVSEAVERFQLVRFEKQPLSHLSDKDSLLLLAPFLTEEF